MNTLYVSDLDGTLLLPDDSIGAYTARVLHDMIRAGIWFTYATARSLTSARVVTRGLPLTLPAIVYNGAFIQRVDTGETVYSQGFSPDGMDALRTLMLQFPMTRLVYAFVDGKECVSWDTRMENDGLRRYLSMRPCDPRLRPVSDPVQLHRGEIFYVTYIGTRDALRPVYEAAKALPECRSTFQQELYRPEYWLELMPARASKAHAARALKRLLGCDRLVSFGDAVNDLPLLEASDEFYAVANAASALRAHASGVIGANTDEGVAHWLEKRLCAAQTSP